MRDRGAERTGGGSLDIGVDPLVIAGGLGEGIDLLLADHAPFADAELGAGSGAHLVEGSEDVHLSVHLR